MLVVCISMLLVYSVGGCAPTTEEPVEEVQTEETAEKPAEESAKEPSESITVRLWFWGEDEAPGLTEWLNESAELYKETHPNVTVENTLLMIDAIYPSFEAAIASGDPPDLHMLWGGVLGLEKAWAGSLTPWDEFWSEEDLSLIYEGTRGECYWNGKQWGVPLYIDPWLAAINKTVWRDAGLDPDNPPTEWDDFVKALEAIKEAGYIPWSVGMKDGYYGAWFPSLIQYQYFDSFTELHKAVIGEQKLTDENHCGWWYAIQEVRDKELFNDDATSITLAEGNDYFLAGNVGFVLGVQPLIAYYMNQMGSENVGVMIAPSPGEGALKGYLPVPAGAEMYIPYNAKHKKEAADFMKFLFTEERANALYARSGAFPGSKNLNPDIIAEEQNQFIYELMLTKSTGAYNFNYPGAFEEALYSIGQQFMAKEIDAEKAAQLYEAAAEEWRKNNPEQIENFKIWVDKPFQP